MKLYLKGERCHSEKCAIEKRNFIPGQHGKDRAKKIVGYGLQLREKQKVRRVRRRGPPPAPHRRGGAGVEGGRGRRQEEGPRGPPPRRRRAGGAAAPRR